MSTCEFFEHLAYDAEKAGCAMLCMLLTVMSDAFDTEHDPDAVESHEDDYREMLESLLSVCGVAEAPIVKRAIEWLDAEGH